jgi:hypothetical protein
MRSRTLSAAPALCSHRPDPWQHPNHCDVRYAFVRVDCRDAVQVRFVPIMLQKLTI